MKVPGGMMVKFGSHVRDGLSSWKICILPGWWAYPKELLLSWAVKQVPWEVHLFASGKKCTRHTLQKKINSEFRCWPKWNTSAGTLNCRLILDWAAAHITQLLSSPPRGEQQEALFIYKKANGTPGSQPTINTCVQILIMVISGW